MKKQILFFTMLLLIVISCKKNSEEIVADCNEDNNTLHEPIYLIQGKIEVQGLTYHQYGTHYIIDDTTYYALRSDLYNLDDFVGVDTTLIGEKIPGYPINPGIDPDFIKVIDFK